MPSSPETTTAESSSNGSSPVASNGAAEAVMRRMSKADPELAAKLIVQHLPVAAATMPAGLSWRLAISELGDWTVRSSGDGPATVEASNGAGDEDFAIETDASGLAALASGSSPLGMMLRRQLRLRGKRRKALALRRLDSSAGPRQMAKLGLADRSRSALPLARLRDRSGVDPRAQLLVAYELLGEGGGALGHRGRRRRGQRAGRASENGAASPDATVRLSVETWCGCSSGELRPTVAMQSGLTQDRGLDHPVTLLGRWIDRAEGVDGPELEREERQREVQAEPRRHLGLCSNGAARHDRPRPGRRGRQARQPDDLRAALRALGEANWRAHELDFSVDREHWLTSPSRGAGHTAWSACRASTSARSGSPPTWRRSCSPPRAARSRRSWPPSSSTRPVTPSSSIAGPAEVMALSADDMRARLKETEDTMLGPWHFLFDDSLRDVAQRITGEARRPRAVRRGDRHLPHGHRGGSGDDRASGSSSQYIERSLDLSGLSARASRWSSRTSTVTSPSACASCATSARAPEMREVVLRTLTAPARRPPAVFMPARGRRPDASSCPTTTTPRRSTASPTRRCDGAWT